MPSTASPDLWTQVSRLLQVKTPGDPGVPKSHRAQIRDKSRAAEKDPFPSPGVLLGLLRPQGAEV